MEKNQLDELRRKYEELKNKNTSTFTGSDKTFLSVPENSEKTVRILPSKTPDQLWYSETKNHKIDGKTYGCLRVKPDGEGKCPICEVYYSLYKTELPENIKLAKSIKPNKRFFINVLDRSTNEVRVLACGIKLYEKILGCFFDPDFGEDFIDPEKGYDFRLIMKKNGEFNDYTDSRPRPKQTPLGNEEEKERWIAGSFDLQRFVTFPTYEEAEQAAALVLSKSTVENGNKSNNSGLMDLLHD